MLALYIFDRSLRENKDYLNYDKPSEKKRTLVQAQNDLVDTVLNMLTKKKYRILSMFYLVFRNHFLMIISRNIKVMQFGP